MFKHRNEFDYRYKKDYGKIRKRKLRRLLKRGLELSIKGNGFKKIRYCGHIC